MKVSEVPATGHAGPFHHLARKVSEIVGNAEAFWIAVFLIVSWAATGPMFGFSDTWQLVVNTATTVITFLIVFLIQHTQNRDNKAVQLKLDELIKAASGARKSMIDLDRLSDSELQELEEEYKRLCNRRSETSRGSHGAREAPDVSERQMKPGRA